MPIIDTFLDILENKIKEIKKNRAVAKRQKVKEKKQQAKKTSQRNKKAPKKTVKSKDRRQKKKTPVKKTKTVSSKKTPKKTPKKTAKKATTARNKNIKKPAAKRTKPVGIVTHYFNKIKVAVIKVTQGTICVGDTVLIEYKGMEFKQKITSMQVESVDVKSAKKGSVIGMKVQKPVKVDAKLYKEG